MEVTASRNFSKNMGFQEIEYKLFVDAAADSRFDEEIPRDEDFAKKRGRSLCRFSI